MKCPHCKTENSEKAKFCRGCGKSVQANPICSHCRHTNLAGSKFCEECGNPLVSDEASTTESSPAFVPATEPMPEPVAFAGMRYEVRKFLGEGGKKKVYLAHDTVLDRDVAFARIKTDKLDEDALIRIKREAQAMARLGEHPNIVTVYDFGSEDGHPYMVLPLLSGGDVKGLIERAEGHKLPLDRAIRVAEDVCSGLAFAHSKGITHRDLKPGNTWLSADGTAAPVA